METSEKVMVGDGALKQYSKAYTEKWLKTWKPTKNY
jgi:hypothetical protein